MDDGGVADHPAISGSKNSRGDRIPKLHSRIGKKKAKEGFRFRRRKWAGHTS
jgi:hypothetical protein